MNAETHSLYLGLDCSTQSLSAVVLESSGARHRVALERSLVFDEAADVQARHDYKRTPRR